MTDTRSPIPALPDLVRMLDVASVLRRERTRAQLELDRDEVRALLRERLLASAAVTGDPVTQAEVDAAIEQYFSARHEHHATDLGGTRWLALLWVRRGRISVWGSALFLVAAAALLLWRPWS